MDIIKPAIRALPLAIFGSLLAIPALADIQPVTPEHCALMAEQGVISDANPVGCERLRVVTFNHHDFDGNDQRVGKVVVLDAVAKNVQIIFDALYDRGFVISSARLMEDYAGSDDASMDDNNTSAFNGRNITGGGSWSNHAYGAAIDLNPLQNPFISIGQDGSATIAPVAAARSSVNRLDQRPNKPLLAGKAEEVVALFADNGFINWGGYWNFPIDYQHFELGNKTFIKRLASSSPEAAEQIFDSYVSTYRHCVARNSTLPEAVARKVCAERAMK
jgi:hypothetical protein